MPSGFAVQIERLVFSPSCNIGWACPVYTKHREAPLLARGIAPIGGHADARASKTRSATMVVSEPARDFAGYAQEFLRRNEAYRAAWRGMQRQTLARRKEQARAWGLAFSSRSRGCRSDHAGTLAAGMPSRHAGPGRGTGRLAQPVACSARRQP